MNWRIKRRLGMVAVVAVTIGPLAWLGTVVWGMAGARRSMAADFERIALVREEIAVIEDTSMLDPELDVAAPGGETAPVPSVPLLAVELAQEANVAEFLARLEMITADAGVVPMAIDLQPSATVGRTAYLIRGRGTPDQICTLLGLIEHERELSLVETLDMVGRDDGLVDVAIGIARHHK